MQDVIWASVQQWRAEVTYENWDTRFRKIDRKPSSTGFCEAPTLEHASLRYQHGPRERILFIQLPSDEMYNIVEGVGPSPSY